MNEQSVKRVPNPWRVGDIVKIPIKTNTFSKGDVITYSKTNHTITKINGYKIYVDNNELKYYKPYQLKKQEPQSRH